MDWVFGVFAVATVLYTLFIIREHIADARVQKMLQESLNRERLELEQKIEESNEEASQLAEQIKQEKETVKELQDMIKNQEIEIQKLDDSRAKQGKYRVE